MTKTVISYRRIDHLKAIALDCGFTNEDAKQFGKLSKTATWEVLLETYGIPLESVDTVDTLDKVLDTVLDTKLEAVDTVDTLDKVLDTVLDTRLEAVDTVDKDVCSKAQSPDTSDWTNDASFPLCNFTPQNSTNFLEWVDFGQLIALALASVGLFVLAMSLWRQINPLNLFPPVKVNIQIGTKL
jgi:hypothetical protein